MVNKAESGGNFTPAYQNRDYMLRAQNRSPVMSRVVEKFGQPGETFSEVLDRYYKEHRSLAEVTGEWEESYGTIWNIADRIEFPLRPQAEVSRLKWETPEYRKANKGGWTNRKPRRISIEAFEGGAQEDGHGDKETEGILDKAYSRNYMRFLPNEQLAVVTLRFSPPFMSPEQVSRVLGIDVDAVENLERSAVSFLKKLSEEKA